MTFSGQRGSGPILCLLAVIFLVCLNACGSDSGSGSGAGNQTGYFQCELFFPDDIPRVSSSTIQTAGYGAHIDCDAIGIRIIRTRFYDADVNLLKSDEFSCSDGRGTSAGVPVGNEIRMVVTAEGQNDMVLLRGEAGNITVTADQNTFGDPILMEYNDSIDQDDDGYGLGLDCDDNNPDIHPTAMEIDDNNVDEDCDGVFGQSEQTFTGCIGNPASYWTLDQSGPPYINEAIDEPDGICASTGCPEPDDDAMVGSALWFNGIDAGITVPDYGESLVDMEINSSFSISLWFRREAGNVDRNEVLVGRYAYKETHFWVGINTNSTVSFLLWDSDIIQLPTAEERMSIGFMSGATEVADGQWHHVVAVRNGQTGYNLIYLDGTLEGRIPVTYTGSFYADKAVSMGNMHNDYYFYGSMDEVALFDVALSGNTIQQLYNAGIATETVCVEE